MIGWGLTLFLVGRVAYRKKDEEILRGLYIGIVLWLIVEGLFSAYLLVWFNVGVDIAVLGLFTLALTRTFARN